MARPLRIEISGGLYHVTSRGDRREDIYLSDDDREAWLAIFAKVCARYKWVCHAYCQMTNHYHIVLETHEANLSLGMRQLNGVYTQYANRAHQQVGHVFQGRYKAILVQKDSYLLELARYVVLNPVRARLVDEPAHWPWSSYRPTIGEAPRPAWLQADWILRQFAQQRKRAVAKYMDFVHNGMGSPGVWRSLRNQIYLGSERFVERMQKHIAEGDLSEIPRAQRRQAKELDYYRARYADRHMGMALAYLSGDFSMKAIAERFGVHYATVSRAVKKHEAPKNM